jgi:tetratricopeptide (TPR) repeat protein
MGEAEEDLKLLKAIYQKEGTGVDYLSRALGLLAQGCEEAASKVDKEKERELYDSLSIKAASYYYDYFQINPPDPKRDADKLNVIADKLFLAAITRLEKIRATGEKIPEEVRGMFEKARDLFAQYRTSGAKIPDETNQLLRQKEAKCFLETGKFDQAIEIYREIAAADPQMSKGNIHEDLADCYMVQARAMQTGSDRTALIKKADTTYGTLAAGLMQNQRINDHFWRLMFKHAECLWETDLELLRSFFGNMTKRGYAPNWDEGKYGYQSKFEDLRKKLEAKLPEK